MLRLILSIYVLKKGQRTVCRKLHVTEEEEAAQCPWPTFSLHWDQGWLEIVPVPAPDTLEHCDLQNNIVQGAI